MITQIKNWFFKNLAAEILKQKPEYEIKKKSVPIAAFESNDLFLSKQQEAEAEEIGIHK